MSELLDLIRTRNAPVFEGGSFYFPDAGVSKVAKDGSVKLADPNSGVIESDDAKMRHRFVISTTAEDRMGDVVVPRGCVGRLERYKKNPVVLLSHNSFGLPIGKSEDPATGEFALEIRDDRILADCFFHCKTEESEKTYELVKLGFLKGASIGFNPIKGELIRKKGKKNADDSDDTINFRGFPGIRFDEWELMEWSVVGIPCNQEALEGMKSWMGKNAQGRRDQAFYAALEAMLPESKSVTVSVDAEVPKEEVSTEAPKQIEVVKIAGVEIKPFTDEEVKTALEKINKEEKAPGEVLQEAFLQALKEEFSTKLADAVKALEAKIPVVTEQKLDALTPPDPSLEVPEEILPEEPKKIVQLGAAVLQKVLRTLDEAYHFIEAKIPQIENKKTAAFLGETHMCLDECMKKVQKFGSKEYPDVFPKAAKSEEPALNSPAAIVETKSEPETSPVPTQSPWTQDGLNKFMAALTDFQKTKKAVHDKLYSITGKR